MNHANLSRRDFVKRVGAAGAVSAVAAGHALGQAATGATNAPTAAAPTASDMPTRTFGRTGVKVSALGLGGIFDITANQLVLQRALDFGVTYWDTAYSYNNGNSEKGMGQYFDKNPGARKKVFLVTKADGPTTAAALTAKLEESLQRLKTDYVDLYFLHGVGSGAALTEDVKAWVEKAKAANKFRYFGFSTHGNMPGCLTAAAKLGWVDGIMLKYDYRLMHTDDMRAAMDAAEKAGIGLTAMKTQGSGPIKLDDDADLKLAGHFVKRGFSEQQAKLKALWENPQLSCICSQMANVTILSANVAAALDRTKLSSADHAALREHASATGSRYCAGCSELCAGSLASPLPVADVLRCLMYQHTYGDAQLARETFLKLPSEVRNRVATEDFAAAERVCPQRLPLGRLMREAGGLLA
jgi:hypothetical protein